MKTFKVIAKILVALAAVAGVVYVVATYGDKIAAWAKKLLGCKCGGNCQCVCGAEDTCDCVENSSDDSGDAEATPAAENSADEASPAIEDGAVVADEADFEG